STATSCWSSTRRRVARPIATRSRSAGRRSNAACRTSPRSQRRRPRPRASRRCTAARSRCGRCRSTTVPASSPGAAPAGALGEVLQALERPLEYLAADDFRRAADTVLPLDAIAARIARARAVDDGRDAVLAELAGIVEELQARAADPGPLLRRA